MFDGIKKDTNLVRILLLLLIIAVGSYVLSIIWGLITHFADIFIILGLSWFLSFILEPLVEKIGSVTRIPKIWATLVTFLLISAVLTAGILLFIPTVIAQIQALGKVIPLYYEHAPQFITRAMDTFTNSLSDVPAIIPSVAQFFFSTFIVLIIAFYFIIDKERINKEIFYLAPKEWHEKIHFIQNTIGDTFSSFLRVQLIFGLLSGLVTYAVFQGLGIEFAASTALLAGIFAIIPLIGPVLAIIPPVAVAFIADPAKAIIVFLFLLITQQLIFNVIGPKLLGNAFKLHPAIIIISFLIGAKVAGSIGAIFAIPIIGILAIITRDIFHHFLKTGKEENNSL